MTSNSLGYCEDFQRRASCSEWLRNSCLEGGIGIIHTLFYWISAQSMIEKYVMPSFDWSSRIQTIQNDTRPSGSQIFNFFSMDKPFQNDPDAHAFVESSLRDARAFGTDAELMRYACEQICLDGIIAEMGVCTGRTINFIAALNPRSTVYGFDSFEGLPNDWNRNDVPLPKGVFGLHDPETPPPVLANVCLIKGMFSETLPIFSQDILKDQPIAFMHIDCDLYQSAMDVFNSLGHRLVPGSILLFDEFYNFPKWDEHEIKALYDFLADSDKQVKYLAYNRNGEQVAVQFL